MPTSKNIGTVLAAIALTVCLASSLVGCGSPDSDESSSVTPDVAVAAAELVTAGLDQLAREDSASAEVTFRQVLVLEPHNVYAHYNLGYIAQKRGDNEAARRAYEQALVGNDDFGPALFNLGILMESKDLDKSVGLYRRAVEADDTFAAAFMRLGFALVHLGSEDEGAAFLEQGIALDPEMAEVEAPSYR